MDSKKNSTKKKLYYRIVLYIIENNKLPYTSLSKQALQYHLNKLKLDGIITKLGKGVWKADKDKLDAFFYTKIVKKQHGGTKDIRGHGFQWRIKLPKIPNWYKRKDYLDRKIRYDESKGIPKHKSKYNYVPSKASWNGQRLMIRGYKCWLLNDCLIIYMPKEKSFYNYSCESAYQMAIIDLLETLKGVESRMGINLKIHNYYYLAPSKQHYAKINDALAKDYNNKKLKLSVKYDGKEWLLVDQSLGRHELEFVGCDTAIDDGDKAVIPVFNAYKEHYEKTGETILPTDLLRMIHDVTKNQVMFDSNFVSHLEVIKYLGTAVNELRNEIKNLKK